MQDYIIERTVSEAEYILASKCTVRECAKVMNVSKSTVHSDISERLERLNRELYVSVKEILGENFSERHIRGGNSTKAKYSRLKVKAASAR